MGSFSLIPRKQKPRHNDAMIERARPALEHGITRVAMDTESRVPARDIAALRAAGPSCHVTSGASVNMQAGHRPKGGLYARARGPPRVGRSGVI